MHKEAGARVRGIFVTLRELGFGRKRLRVRVRGQKRDFISSLLGYGIDTRGKLGRGSVLRAVNSTATVKMSGVGTSTGVAAYTVTTSPAKSVENRPSDADSKKHHLKNGKGFQNPWDSFQELKIIKFFADALMRRFKPAPTPSPSPSPPAPLPTQPPSLLRTRSHPSLRATWLGHACYYLEFPSGLRVLTDPVFEPYCSPIHLPHLRRYTDPPCQIEDLPFVDAVLVSHNHYDHLSLGSVRRVKAKFPGARFWVPLGLKSWFESSGVKNVCEVDWWEEGEMEMRRVGKEEGGEGREEVIKATFTALPAQHNSKRTPWDTGKTLWCGWGIESGGRKVYFAGDTGYRTVTSVPSGTSDHDLDLPHCPAFSQIGAHAGPFDLGLIPIGAYEPRWAFSAVHADPRDAVSIFLDTRCERGLGMHWGTWALTYEGVWEPVRGLVGALRERGLGGDGKEGEEGWEEESRGVFGWSGVGETREF
ncbi:Metallo-hydrolase/oxidoreductase [Polyplosphaeria fusca]|uniref:Metallo-hydrolase/oxidoreductase n=1 Tax=Polyplosphaeria fusca TaxID=682080 RepID=A0A9P4V058_9PLEO|nr:Metallo-hydrolase/oxidoreductase [Polyplosphaeria fusca]